MKANCFCKLRSKVVNPGSAHGADPAAAESPGGRRGIEGIGIEPLVAAPSKPEHLAGEHARRSDAIGARAFASWCPKHLRPGSRQQEENRRAPREYPLTFQLPRTAFIAPFMLLANFRPLPNGSS